ncbi:MAG: (4Fe-4S)-binding protein [Bacteroidetes bacterium GWE2_29_8]|nr:MAG: (4Fe-4S)-binding protein [Bacteroidetes bacterium GWE2_29_8]
MKNFGFSINEDRQIDFDKRDDRLYKYICKEEPSFVTCIECGSCGATCSAGNFTTFSLRKINTSIKRGLMDIVREDIKKCMLCGKCQLVCPRGINTRNVLIKILEGIDKINRNEL